MNRRLAGLCAAFTLASSACGGGSGSGAAPPPAKTASKGTGQIAFSVLVPLKPAPSAARRKPAYISPATQSVSFQVGTSAVQVIALTLGSATCPLGPNGYTCTAYANVPAGNEEPLTIDTYATTDGTGAVLSENTIMVTVIAGEVNPVTVSLNGVAASLAVFVTPTALPRCVPTNLTATWSALDAAGYTIVGPGTIVNASGTPVAPTLAVSDAVHFTVGAQTGNSWAVSYNGGVGASPVTFSVSNAGVTTGSAPVTVGPALLLFATEANAVAMFAPPYTSAPTVISNSVSNPVQVLVSSTCTLFIANANANFGTTVTAYAPPYTGAPIATMSASGVVDAALTPAGNIFILTAYPGDNVIEYAPPYTGLPVATFSFFEADISVPTHLAVDPSNDVFVAGSNAFTGGNTLAMFNPPYSGAPTPISGTNNPQRMLVQSGTNDLFVTNLTSPQTVYAPPYTAAPFASIAQGANIDSAGMAFDAANDLFVAFSGSSTVVEYAPPYTAGPLRTISSGLIDPVNVAVDPSTGNLFVANLETSQVTAYAPPYTGAPFVTLAVPGTNGALAISP